MTDQFDNPDVASSIDWKELDGRLLLIKPLRVELGVRTKLGEKDAVAADVHVVDGPDPGEISEAFIFPLVLQSQTRKKAGTGRYILGRLGQGVAKPGQSAPWKLADPTDDEQDAARRYLNGRNVAAPDNAAADDDPPPWEKK